MAVLFLAPADLGETVLATAALAHVLREGDDLTVLTTADARPLFRAVPGLKALYTVEGINDVGRFIELAWSRRERRFELMLDIRRTPAALVLPAKRKLILPATEVLRHFSEDLSLLVGSERTLAPTIWLPISKKSNSTPAMASLMPRRCFWCRRALHSSRRLGHSKRSYRASTKGTAMSARDSHERKGQP